MAGGRGLAEADGGSGAEGGRGAGTWTEAALILLPAIRRGQPSSPSSSAAFASKRQTLGTSIASSLGLSSSLLASAIGD